MPTPLEPCAAARAVRDRADGRRLALFLDFDGTLAPIVARPEAARPDEAMLAALAKLAAAERVVVVSGRALADVRGRLPVAGLGFAGSHGWEIDVPDVAPAPVARPEVADLVTRAVVLLQERLATIPGAAVDAKTYAVAVHWRHVDPARVAEVERVVDAVGGELGALRKTHGRKVFELRPLEDWDKGRAVAWIRDGLGLVPAAWLVLFAGDDVTDLDALAVIRGDGLGVVVGDAIAAEPGDLVLADPAAMRAFLTELARGPG